MKLVVPRPPVLRHTGTGHRWKSVRVLVAHDGAGKEEEEWCYLRRMGPMCTQREEGEDG
jgi:hypothetical protein